MASKEEAALVLENCAVFIKSAFRYMRDEHVAEFKKAYSFAIKELRKPPAVDTAVVRCKDCVYATYTQLHRGDEPVIWRCERFQCPLFDENSFCSWAAKKAQPIQKEKENAEHN